ncbi:MAG: sulfatase-like hydrolase/transferase, partial [Cetobacterium sp.]|uniref:sulfatase-like hydrolase/transferase n=1 Tax=Cetobacterium sp. TaxID=2071632 RepID=UPI003F419E77
DYEKICKRENIPLFGVVEDRVKVSERHGEIYEDRQYTGSRVSLFEKSENLFRDRFYIDNALNYLDSEAFEKPIGMFINIWAPHPPFRVLKELMDRFPDPELPENINKICEGEPLKRRDGIAAQLAEEKDLEHWKDVWRAYLGLTNYADELIGEIIEKLKEKGEYENTMFVFTADHGDHLGQHKMFQKMEMYEQSINVPLIMKVPEKSGVKVETVVSHLDVLPTILESLNIESDEVFIGENILNNETLKKSRYAYSQYSGNQVAIGDIRRSIVSKEFKYIYDPRDLEELFNLKKDPLEMKNEAGNIEYKEVKKNLKNQLSLFLKEQNDWINII